MSKTHVAVLKIISNELSITEAASRYGISRRQLHRLLARYHQHGIDGLEPRSRRPHTSPHTTPTEVRERILELRTGLTRDGHDAGPVTIAWHLERAGITAPSTSTIRRILHDAGLITAEPRKRPKNSFIRFEAALPNETWQSDFTHWHLSDGTDIEILNWLDDHSRYLLNCRAFPRVTGNDVVDTFLALTGEHGVPASTLTDNGTVYTARFVGGRNAFEHLLPLLGVTQKNGSPGHPQTQGKIERFHQTLKRWLAKQPAPATIKQLQTQLDQFREEYNEHRPTAHSTETPRDTRTAAPRKPGQPERPARGTTASGTTTSPRTAKSRSAGPAACTTSASESRTPKNGFSSSSMKKKSSWSTSRPEKFSPPTGSIPPAATGGIHNESPADGRTLVCDISRDSSETHVPTHHMVEPRRIELLTSCLQSRRSTN